MLYYIHRLKCPQASSLRVPMRTSLAEGVCLGHGSASGFARHCWLESWPPVVSGGSSVACASCRPRLVWWVNHG